MRLLHCTTRSVTPTEAGQCLLDRLDPALQAEPTGTLRMNVPRPAARLVLAGFVAKYPRVQVDVVTDDGLADIVEDGFDAGIRFGESLTGGMVAVPLGAAAAFRLRVAAPSFSPCVARHGRRASCPVTPALAAVSPTATATPGSSR